MGATDPVSGVPDHNRGYDNADQDRYRAFVGKGEAGCFEYRAVTLEDEARYGGWLPNNTPTGPQPIDLMTVGMRGEPGYDDDPKPTARGFSHDTADDGDNSSYD